MKNIEEQLEMDILRFIENIENQTQNAKVETLRNMFRKYIHLSTSDYLMDTSDLQSIIGSAKSSFANDTFPIYLGENKRKVIPQDLPNLCVIEATIGHLQKNGCLKKLPKFDKKEDKL